MNEKQENIQELIQRIRDLDFHQGFKEILLLTLDIIRKNSANDLNLTLTIDKLIKIREEVYVYTLGEVFEELKTTFYIIAREFLRFEGSRKRFYQKIRFDYQRERHPQMNWRPFMFIGLFDYFLRNTDENEIILIFGKEIDEFHQFFYDLVLADISEKYYASRTLTEYYDLIREINLGQKFSRFIKLKIKKCVDSEDIEEFYKIFVNFSDAIKTDDLLELFSFYEINIIPFLLKNISFDDYFRLELENFNYFLEKKSELRLCIGDSLLHILPNYQVEEWNDPLYLLGFFECLSKKQIQSLIINPEVDFFMVLMKFQCTEWTSDEILAKFIEEKVDFYRVGRDVLREKNYEKIYWFWDRWLLFRLNLNYTKKLLEDSEIDFVESLVKSAYLYKKFKDEVGVNFLFPSKIQYNLRSLMIPQITQIIKLYEKEAFIPMLAMRLLDYFNSHQLLELLKNKELNLLDKINHMLEHHYEEILEINESFYRWKINFLKFLSKFNIPVSDQIDRVEPAEGLSMWLAPSPEEVGYPIKSVNDDGLEEYVSIAGKKIFVYNGVLDLSGLNIYNLEEVEGLFGLKTIKVLSLSNNFIRKLPGDIGNLTTLEKILIENSIVEIPESILNCKSLRYMRLDEKTLELQSSVINELRKRGVDILE